MILLRIIVTLLQLLQFLVQLETIRYVNINSEYEMKTTGKVLLDQLTTIDYEARVYFGKAHDSLVEELLMKVRTVFQK